MFLIPFVLLAILLPKYMGLQLDNNSIPLLILSSLILMGMILLYSKKGHQSQLPQYIGLPLILLGIIALVSSIGINGSEQLIELSAKTQAYSMIGIGIGVGLVIVGIKKSQRSAKSMF